MATKQFVGGRLIHGTEYAGYKYKVFDPGTSTLKTTYKDSGLTAGNENTSTITLDANGAAQIWFDGNADVVFYTPADVVVYSDDDVNLSSSTSQSGDFNLALNNSFEDDSDGDGIPDNWTRTLYSGGAFTVDTTTQKGGSDSVKFTSTGTGGGYIASTNSFVITPSTSYSVGFSLKSSAADVRNVAEVLWYKADGSASATASTTLYDDSTTNPTSWTEKWYQTASPSDAYFGKIRLTGCHSSDPTAGSTWFDDVYFTDAAIKRAVNTFTQDLTVQSTDAGASVGPRIIADRNSATPAASDVLGSFDITGRDAGGGTDIFGRITAQIDDTTAGSEDGSLLLQRVIAGTLATALTISATAINAASGMTFQVNGASITSAANGSSLVLLSSHTASNSATLDVTSNISSTYDRYLLAYVGFAPATDAASLWIRVTKDAGSNWESGASDYQYRLVIGDGTSSVSTGAAQIALSNAAGMDNQAAGSFDADITLYRPSTASIYKSFRVSSSYIEATGNNLMSEHGSGIFTDGANLATGAAAINGVRTLMSSGNIARGTLYVFGYKTS